MSWHKDIQKYRVKYLRFLGFDLTVAVSKG